jgi:Spy/CpxP family protein refolding chaperone
MKTMEMSYRRFSLSALAVAVLGVLALTPALAQEPGDTGARPSLKAASNEVAIPACLETLTLSQQQENQIREIIRDYDADLALVWKQFGTCYLKTVRTEALLLTAIEDNLTESQRQKVRDERRRTAQHQKSLAGKGGKPNQSTTKAVSAVEEEIGIVGVTLTAEQEAAADKLQEKCLGSLRSLNRDIQGLHIRLVSLEADKLVEIENVLTPDQLRQLRENRQNAPIGEDVSSKVTTSEKTR